MASRRGFTLIELLVVITIIGILMALLLPAVNAAVEQARQTGCMNNQSQLTKAIITYEATFSKYPGYCGEAKTSTGVRRRIPWTISIFPYIDNNALYVDYSDGTPVSPAPEVGVFMCLSDPPDTRGQPTNSYIINSGKFDSEFAPNGVATNRFDTKIYTNADSIKSGDGSTNVLILSENLIAANWDANFNGSSASKELHSMVWHMDFNGNKRINGGIKTTPPPTTVTMETARPSSYHQGGVAASFLDAHTIFLREDIDYKVYVQLLTSNHQQSTAGATEKLYRLNSADYQ